MQWLLEPGREATPVLRTVGVLPEELCTDIPLDWWIGVDAVVVVAAVAGVNWWECFKSCYFVCLALTVLGRLYRPYTVSRWCSN